LYIPFILSVYSAILKAINKELNRRKNGHRK
jgi:hypothetical protein